MPDRIEVYDASTGAAIAQVLESGSEGFAAAVERACAAARAWSAIGAVARAIAGTASRPHC